MENTENNLIELKEITREQFDALEDDYTKNGGNIHFYYLNDKVNSLTFGIYYNKELVGFITSSAFIFDSVEVRTLVKKEYRGRGISSIAKQKLIEMTGEFYKDKVEFISLINYDNEASINAAKKSGWKFDSEKTEILSEEGTGQGYQVFTTNNPYYEKKKKTL